MPQGEIETHPYLQLGQVNGATKLILGSFPVYECTDNDNQIKQQKREIEGTIRFFYGSNRNSLWLKYNQYIDNTITQPWNAELIIRSLNERGIAISDIIKSCERYGFKKIKGERVIDPFSSEDSALNNINWNRDLITRLISNDVTKVLCTSKGVLKNLKDKFICYGRTPLGIEDIQMSNLFQDQFIETINGDNTLIKNNIAKVFIIGNRIIHALAIPSPGSPQRKIKEFGCNTHNKTAYANNYFRQAFNWLTA